AGSLGYAIFCPLWGWLSDRWGVKPMLFRGTFLTAIICPVMMVCAAPWQLVATRFVMASCAGTTAASQILVVKNTPDNHQGFALGVLSTAYWTGAMLGNVLGGLAVHYYGYNVAFILCGLTYAIGGVCIFFCHEQKSTLIAKEKNAKAVKAERRWEAFTPSVLAVLLLFTLFSVVRNFEIPYLAMLVEDISGHDLAAKYTGVVSAFVAFGAFLSGIVIGKLADKTKPLILLIPSLVCSSVCLSLQAFSQSVLLLGTARTTMYFIGGALMPVLEKLLSKITPAQHRGSVFGVKSTASGMGIMFSTVASGVAINFLGVRGVFHCAALLTFLFIPLCIFMVWKVQKNNA
ncbi:MAG: MFS transporter, partial [Victivallales bacterium]|nr:MFS transporter [Victivallales bacterium]